YQIESQDPKRVEDTILWLYAKDGITAITYNDNSGDQAGSARIVWQAPISDTYYVQVESYWNYARIDYTIRAMALAQYNYLPLISQAGASSATPKGTPTPPA